MKILAVDTSSQSLVACVSTPSYREESDSRGQGMQHSERLMPQIHELCNHAGITTGDFDLLVCTRGPGSFTGLRIGMAALKGISLGCGTPLVSVSTLETWARTVDDFDGVVVSVIDAKKDRFYLAAFECNNGVCSRLCNDLDGNIEDLVPFVSGHSKIMLTGPDSALFSGKVVSFFGQSVEVCVCSEPSRSFASALASFGKEAFEKNGADDIGQGPVYIRKSDAEVALEEKNQMMNLLVSERSSDNG